MMWKKRNNVIYKKSAKIDCGKMLDSMKVQKHAF